MADSSRVSVIVPVYNVAKYLSACVESICRQTYVDMQIILVDDGSTDGSSQLCETLTKSDSRIILISQKNTGVSSARNAGLEQASGKFVCFVDADDLLEPQAIATMVNQSNGCDLLISRYSIIDEVGSLIEESEDYSSHDVDSDLMMDALLIPQKAFGYQGYLWNKLFVNEIIQSNNVRFTKGILYNEDRLFISQYLLHSTKIHIISDKTYQYRRRPTSAMGETKAGFNLKQISELDAFILIENELQTHNSPLYKKSVMATMRGTSNLYITIPHSKEYSELRRELKSSIKKRLGIVCFGRSPYLSFNNRCHCIYYYLRTLWR